MSIHLMSLLLIMDEFICQGNNYSGSRCVPSSRLDAFNRGSPGRRKPIWEPSGDQDPRVAFGASFSGFLPPTFQRYRSLALRAYSVKGGLSLQWYRVSRARLPSGAQSSNAYHCPCHSSSVHPGRVVRQSGRLKRRPSTKITAPKCPSMMRRGEFYFQK
jgi:hypothetical protein